MKYFCVTLLNRNEKPQSQLYFLVWMECPEVFPEKEKQE